MKYLIIALAAAALIGGGLLLASRDPQAQPAVTVDQSPVTDTQPTDKTDNAPAATSEFTASGQQIVGNYYEYSKADYEAAKAAQRPIFLFFYANWCPTCAKQEPVVRELMSDIADESKLDDLVAFRVNFNDNATDKDEEALAKELGVTYQHTMFVFDEDGKQLNKWLSQTSKELLRTAFQAAVEA